MEFSILIIVQQCSSLVLGPVHTEICNWKVKREIFLSHIESNSHISEE